MSEEQRQLCVRLDTSPGAIVSFVGLVRDSMQESNSTGLTLEHFPGMTESSIEQIVVTATKRWQVAGVRVIHRVGRLFPGDQIVLVLTAGAHRREAFEACEYIMDYLKTEAVIWKKEHAESGEKWLTPRSSDAQRMKHWTE